MASTKEPKVEEEKKPTNEEGKEVEFIAPDCPVEKVTVYPDRAEVCRRVEASLSSGLNQVVIKKLPVMVHSDSIRVEGKGAATITEVVFHSESVPKGEGDISTQEKELEDEKEQLNEQMKLLESELSVLKKRWTLLGDFATTASKGGAGTTKDGEKAPGGIELTEPFFKGLTAFLELYSKEGNALERDQLELDKKITAVKKKHDAICMNLNKLRKERNRPDEIRKCIIVVDCKESCKVSLLVSYVTSSASWKPSYDIRMYSAEDMLKITYYGQIKQSTGEDWSDAKLYLSTAMPSIGGEIPELFTAELNLYKQRPSQKKGGVVFARAGSSRRSRTWRDSAQVDDYMLDYRLANIEMESEAYMRASRAPPPPPLMVHAEAEVGEGMATTMYEIQRRSTIPSDGIEHKVTVGLISIQPRIHYACIPQLVPHAFMLAKVINSSPFTFLSGDTSIFLDNTFVGKASMKDVYPMEEFDCSLGVDPAVKVTYKPQKKFQASSGILSKVVSTTREQVIEVKNTHDFPVHIVLQDQLPRSTDERIKVNLLEPQIDLKHPERSRDKGAILNKSNNIEWTIDIQAQGSTEIVLKYTVEHPANFKLNKDLKDPKD
ncbi:protein F37C4.5-like isoform X1 [Babylonia areolata]|uniref:protein F37C4.5-like isoform X1 n=1 Tax=Babylonia areolata TaxID=304850 RepID=UPI003FD5A55C